MRPDWSERNTWQFNCSITQSYRVHVKVTVSFWCSDGGRQIYTNKYWIFQLIQDSNYTWKSAFNNVISCSGVVVGPGGEHWETLSGSLNRAIINVNCYTRVSFFWSEIKDKEHFLRCLLQTTVFLVLACWSPQSKVMHVGCNSHLKQNIKHKPCFNNAAYQGCPIVHAVNAAIVKFMLN